METHTHTHIKDKVSMSNTLSRHSQMLANQLPKSISIAFCKIIMYEMEIDEAYTYEHTHTHNDV